MQGSVGEAERQREAMRPKLAPKSEGQTAQQGKVLGPAKKAVK